MAETAYERVISALERHGATVRHRGERQAQAQCPGHDDRSPSLSVTGIEGRALIHCHAGCAPADVLSAVGLTLADLYDDPGRGQAMRYPDGRIVHRRPRPDGGKHVYQSGHTSGTALYRADRVAEASAAGLVVALVEGEQDVHAMEAMGIPACCAPMGAANLRRADPAPLRGATVWVVPDQDEPGQQWARQVRPWLHGVTSAIRWWRPAAGNDPADHVAAGYWADDLVETGPPDQPDPAGSDDEAPHPADDEHQGASDRTGAVLAELERLRVQREARRMLAAEERPAAAAPEPETLADLLASPPDEVTWRVRDWLPAGGRAVLSAQYKSGKTTMVGNLLRCLVDGDPWLGRWQVEPVAGRVVVLDLEMSRGQLRGWLGDQRIRGADRVVVVPLRGAAASLDLLDPATLTQWAQRLRSWDASVVVLDCLRPLMDALGLDESRDAGRLLTALDELLRVAQVPEALVVHHMGHTSERARGDSRIRDWPDVEWRLVRQDDDPASPRYVSAYGRDVDQREQTVSHDPTTRHLTVGEGSRADAADREASAAVLTALERADGPLTQRQVEAATRTVAPGVSREAVRRTVTALERAGSVQVTHGPRGARHISVPVCGSVRERAGDDPRSTAPVCGPPIGGHAGTVADAQHTAPDEVAQSGTVREVPAQSDDGCRRWLPDDDRRCGDVPVGRWQIGPLCATHAPAVPTQPGPDSPSSGAASAVLGDDCGVDGCGQPRAGGSRTCRQHTEQDIYAAAAV